MAVPVLDWQRFSDPTERSLFVDDLGNACRDTGFFLLQGHGVEPSLIGQVFSQAAQFFKLPEPEKAKLAMDPNNRGWAAVESERLDPESGQSDCKEAFNIGLDLLPDDPRIQAGEPFRGLNRWPPIEGFAGTMRAYFAALHVLGVRVMRAIALNLGLPETRFDADFTAPIATLRLLSYPAARPDTSIGAGAHTDYGALTFLLTDGTPGLQVCPRIGDWIDVPHQPGAFIVNIGDCLMRWSNDIYVSTPHRVLPPPTQRQSVAFFLDPNPEAIIAALPGTGRPKYPAVTGADYLRERLEATYG